jgi:phospholipid/cholesterol/gamma-HCH transport system substrate-binding protein
MRARKKDQKNLVKVGIFVTGLTTVLMIMIVSIGKETSLFEPKVDIKARVGNVSNLKPGSYVELKGIRIGSVTNIEIISEEEVEITMHILEHELKWIKSDSKVSISTAGLVGDKFVEIYKGTKEAQAFIPKKDILTSEESTDFKKIISKGESIASITERLLIKVDTILLNMNDGKPIVEMISSLNKASRNLEKVSSDLTQANVPQMIKNVNASMMSFNKSSSSLERILTRVEQGPGTANSLIYDDSVHDDLRALLGGAQRNKVIKYYIRESIKKAEQRQPQER